jgi:pyrroloquinoline-quinone synthase
MHTQRIREVLAEAIVGRHLLTHPFYRRWEAGTLSEGELAAYAEQYRHIERELPVTLETIVAALPPGRARQLVEANLADELATPAPHTELFESFAQADPALALAMVAAYEVQASSIAASKSEGLRRHYGLDEDATCFWDVHRTQESEHADWSVEALAELGADPDIVQAAATVSADSWWLFLSERDELAPVGVGG